MDGMEIEVTQEKAYGGDQLTSMMKFDEYFMYGIDNLGGDGNNAPPCGPGVESQCMEGKSCCSHVLMTDNYSGEQTSFYRCMNMMVVDASITMSIDDMQVSMSCMDSGSTYMASAIMASLAALVSVTIF